MTVDEARANLMVLMAASPSRAASRAIDAYAHALAEQIRNISIAPSGDPKYDGGKTAGIRLAAGVTDPEDS